MQQSQLRVQQSQYRVQQKAHKLEAEKKLEVETRPDRVAQQALGLGSVEEAMSGVAEGAWAPVERLPALLALKEGCIGDKTEKDETFWLLVGAKGTGKSSAVRFLLRDTCAQRGALMVSCEKETVEGTVKG